MGLGFGLGLPFRRTAVAAAVWSPDTAWFASSEQGLWYDPSDLSSLFQDSAGSPPGTVPVTAFEQPSGTARDKSGRGNHATQATSTARPTGRNRYNQVFGAFAGAVAGTPGTAPTGWSMFGTGGSTVAVTALGGGNNSITYSATSARQFINFAVAVSANSVYKAKITATLVSGTLDLSELINASISPAGTTITYALNGTTVASSTSLTGTAEVELTITVAGTAGTSNLRLGVGCTANRTASVTISRASFVALADAGLEYQSVRSATDYDSDQTKFYAPLSFDGSDDSLAATSGGGTTGGTWVFGIRLGALGAARTIWSDAGTNTGYRLRINSSNQVVFEAGNGSAYTSATVATALTLGQRCVITAWHDGSTLSVQVDNGTVATAAMGTATAGTAACTIGKANGAASEYFLGYLYGGIYVRNEAKADRAAAKTYMGTKLGLTL